MMLTAIVICIIGAMLSGLVAGLLGLGGGAVLVPLFFFLFPLFDVSMHLKNIVIGTTLMCIIFTSISSVYSHYKKQGIYFPIVPAWGGMHFIGAILGGYVAVGISENSVRIVYVVMILALVLFRLIQPNKVIFSHQALFRGGLVIPFSFGWLSSTIGIGGGTNVHALPLFGIKVKNAVATASVMGLIISVPATVVYIVEGWQYMDTLPAYSLGYVNILMVGVVVPITMITARFSARLTYVLTHRQLNTIACLLGLFFAVQMGIKLI